MPAEGGAPSPLPKISPGRSLKTKSVILRHLLSKRQLSESKTKHINNSHARNSRSRAQAEANFASTYMFLATPVVLWLTVATAFYHNYNGWTLCESFYYSVQSGLSIGFGVLTEQDDLSRAFTTFHVMLGALGITVMLSLLLETALVALAAQRVLNRYDKRKTNESIFLGDSTKRKDPSLCKQLVDAASSAEVIVAVLWLAIGTGFAMKTQNFSWVQAVYFSVTAVSTGGLQGVDRNDSSLFLTGIFVLVGVPLFGIATGKLATIVMEHRSKARMSKLLNNEQIDLQRFFTVAKSLDQFQGLDINSDDSPTIDLAEYLCMELEALGLVSREHLGTIIESFIELDRDHNGSISLSDAQAAGLIHQES